jgi:hypothetical protein
VIVANSMIMTVFLWHITAMVLASMVALPLGFPQPRPGSIAWWALRPAWIAILGVVLVPFVLALARFERPQRRAPRAIHPALGALGVTAFVLALAGFATNGFAGVLEPANGLALTPLRSAGLMLAGAAALAGYPRRRCDERGS